MLWLANARRLKALEEELETHQRVVRLLEQTVEDMESRVRKLAFRVGKLAAPGVEVPDMPKQESGSPGGGADPISAALLARRSRGRVHINGAPAEDEVK